MRGFTLVEMLVVIAVTGIVGVALNSLIVQFYKSSTYLMQETSAIDSAHTGIASAFTELREASYGADGSYPIVAAGTSTITFFSDMNGDGTVDKIRIYLQNNTLFQGVTLATGSPPTYDGRPEATSTIASYVRNGTSTPIFTYYDSSGAQLSTTSTNIAQIASVATQLMIDLDPNRAPAIFTLKESATLRNLRTN